MNNDFLELFIEAPELGKFLFSCKPIHKYSEEEIIDLSRSLRVNKGELEYRIQSRHLNRQSIQTGENNYEKF
ncbi:hypothetical protein [Sphingobacterium sp. BN32]|uniref:hypothetical protein n=1 Tax=Sphingobacterium sp. BN32 TaxID=3058432 RepID=UPI00265D2542|nr:hypothetical protein [Sphingobacterium sp. BN32]WKK58578.1 hypothetical protein QYC40_18310 [Sphingobacterium sp. BN32]